MLFLRNLNPHIGLRAAVKPILPSSQTLATAKSRVADVKRNFPNVKKRSKNPDAPGSVKCPKIPERHPFHKVSKPISSLDNSNESSLLADLTMPVLDQSRNLSVHDSGMELSKFGDKVPPKFEPALSIHYIGFHPEESKKVSASKKFEYQSNPIPWDAPGPIEEISDEKFERLKSGASSVYSDEDKTSFGHADTLKTEAPGVAKENIPETSFEPIPSEEHVPVINPEPAPRVENTLTGRMHKRITQLRSVTDRMKAKLGLTKAFVVVETPFTRVANETKSPLSPDRKNIDSGTVLEALQHQDQQRYESQLRRTAKRFLDLGEHSDIEYPESRKSRISPFPRQSVPSSISDSFIISEKTVRLPLMHSGSWPTQTLEVIPEKRLEESSLNSPLEDKLAIPSLVEDQESDEDVVPSPISPPGIRWPIEKFSYGNDARDFGFGKTNDAINNADKLFVSSLDSVPLQFEPIDFEPSDFNGFLWS